MQDLMDGWMVYELIWNIFSWVDSMSDRFGLSMEGLNEGLTLIFSNHVNIGKFKRDGLTMAFPNPKTLENLT